jgi:hypothetical protein
MLRRHAGVDDWSAADIRWDLFVNVGSTSLRLLSTTVRDRSSLSAARSSASSGPRGRHRPATVAGRASSQSNQRTRREQVTRFHPIELGLLRTRARPLRT